MSRLDPRLLLQGYATGIFPMADSREAAELFWVEPRNRAVIPLDRFHVSRSLRRVLRSGRFDVTRDRESQTTVRRLLVFEKTFGKVPVLAIPDMRYIDKSQDSFGPRIPTRPLTTE